MGAFKLNNSEESWKVFLEAVRGKTLMNDRYMSAFFRDFPEGVQLVISIILNKPDIEVVEVRAQDTFTNLYGRTVRILRNCLEV